MNPGSRLQNYPHILELSYQVADRLFSFFDPLISRLGYERVGTVLLGREESHPRHDVEPFVSGAHGLYGVRFSCGLPTHVIRGEPEGAGRSA